MKTIPQAVFLDRDGVINVDSPDYILTPDQWQPISGSLKAIARLTEAGIPITIVSNQSIIGRGMVDRQTLQAIHHRMLHAIEAVGGHIAHTAYCPHTPEDHCACRKPEPGLLLDTIHALNLHEPFSSIIFIGDTPRDVQAAVSAGVTPILVQSGYHNAVEMHDAARMVCPDIAVYPDLSTVVDALLCVDHP